MSAGMLTGHPAEEMPGSAGDILPEFLQLHEQVQGSMAALPIMEDISLPTRCKGSLGHGEDTIYQG